jgi:hypothetical protein
MMKYNEWKVLNESLFSLGLKTNPTIGGPIYEGGFNFGKDKDDDSDSDEDDYDDEDGDDDLDDDEDGDLEDDQLDGDIFGASKEEGGPQKSFPPDDSEEMENGDDMNFDDDQFDLAGLGDDHSSFGKMGGKGAGLDDLGGMGGDDLGGMGGDDLGGMGGDDLGGGMDDMMGGDDMGGAGLDDLGGMAGDDLGGGLDDLGGMGGDDMGGGDPCPDCNPEGDGEGDPECHTCHGHGFLDDMDGGDDMGGGEIDGGELGQDIDKMNLMSKMTNYQKKYMGANPPMGQAPQMGQQAPQMGGQPQAQQPQMNAQQMTQMQQQQRMQTQQGQPMMQKKFMAAKPQQDRPVLQTRKPDNGEDMRKRAYCGTCENTVGTYKETQEDFFANLVKNAKGETRQKFHSGIYEDALLQAVDPNYQAEPQAGQAGFAPQGRVGSIGGGYTQDDIKDLPVLGESKKYPTLSQYNKAKGKKRR